MDHKTITPSTELKVGDTVPYKGFRFEIWRITQDDGILLSNCQAVCRTEIQTTEHDLVREYIELVAKFSELFHAAEKAISKGATIEYNPATKNSRSYMMIAELDYKDLRRAVNKLSEAE